MSISTTQLTRASNAPVSASAFAISANGLYTRAQVDALKLLIPYSSFGETSASPKPNMRAARVLFCGTAADNTTHDWKAVCGWKIGGQQDADASFLLVAVAYGTFTLGSSVGADSAGGILTTERVADAITWATATTGTTPIGVGDVINAQFGGVAADDYSPADNTPGILFLSELGNPDILFIDLDAASDTINAVIARDT